MMQMDKHAMQSKVVANAGAGVTPLLDVDVGLFMKFIEQQLQESEHKLDASDYAHAWCLAHFWLLVSHVNCTSTCRAVLRQSSDVDTFIRTCLLPQGRRGFDTSMRRFVRAEVEWYNV